MVTNAVLLLIALPALGIAKPNLAGPSAHEKFGDRCRELYAGMAEPEKKRLPGYDKEARIRVRDATFEDITDRDNVKFLSFAKAANEGLQTPGKLFLDIENAVLKALNDKVIEDRELVTALTNLHKKVVWSVVSNDEMLAKSILGKYSDFKSLRFAFDSDSPRLQERAAAALGLINKKYSEYLADLAQKNGWTQKLEGLTADTRNWYHGGMGITPDQAGIATRYSRENLQGGVAVLRTFREAAPDLQQAAYNAARFQRWAAKRFEGIDGFLVNTERGERVLSVEAIEAIKKATAGAGESQSEAVARALNARFRLKISAKDAKGLENYLGLVDKFSPGLLLSKRVVIDMGQAARGVISADFKGQNARNLEQTMKALTDTNGLHVAARLQAVRRGEIAATEALEAKKIQFQRALDRAFPEKNLRAEFTGDDGVVFVKFDLTPEMRKKFQAAWLEEGRAEDIRLAFVPFEKDGVKIAKDARSEWIVKAEGLEKKLRVQLIEKVPRERLNGLQIGIHLAPDVSGNAVAEIQLGMEGGKPVSAADAEAVLAMARALGYRAKLMDKQ